jgi:hypothetical protein
MKRILESGGWRKATENVEREEENCRKERMREM